MVQTAYLREAAAYHRFGLGARRGRDAAGDSAYIRLLREIGEPVPEPGGGRLKTSRELLLDMHAYGRALSAAKKAGGEAPVSPAAPHMIDEVGARYELMMEPDIGLTERLVMFWSNHFAVSRDKSGTLTMLSGAFEREAIRPFVYGRFFDMLLAVETHPAMLYFLDNASSTGPGSPAARAARQGPGLNENLAREILELHTLGVRTGYSQADVRAFARILTGWSVGEAAEGEDAGRFIFRNASHEPGPRTLMGRVYPEDGMRQGGEVLGDLAAHPATARHIAFKLARHFISDVPPPALVDELAATFLDTEGDLEAVTRALVQSDAAVTTPLVKLRTPQEYLAAVLRATGQTLDGPQANFLLTRLGQPMWQPGGPNGYSDISTVWANPVGLQGRIQTITMLARRTDAAGPIDPRRFADEVLPAGQSAATRAAVAHADSRPQGLAIALLSPEFMRR